MVNDLLRNTYGLSVNHVEKSVVGAGSDTFFVTCPEGKYVLKFPCESKMNNPRLEPPLCDYLIKKGLPVSEFILNASGAFISANEEGRIFHLQKFIEGRTYELNTAPKWLLKQSAQLLGKIHTALADYVGLPEGIGKSFLKYMMPESAQNSYKSTLNIAKRYGDKEIENDLLYRIDLVSRFPEYNLDVDKLSCRNTHGDYFISQLICGQNRINAVIDWTTACVHPVVWEIIRSFVYACPNCKNGEIDIAELIDYVSAYLEYAELSRYDIETMPKLFYYQLAVCDYYNQYYKSTADNRNIYLHQAVFSTKLMKWFDENIDDLTEALITNLAQ